MSQCLESNSRSQALELLLDGLTQALHESEGAAQLKPTQATQVTECAFDASQPLRQRTTSKIASAAVLTYILRAVLVLYHPIFVSQHQLQHFDDQPTKSANIDFDPGKAVIDNTRPTRRGVTQSLFFSLKTQQNRLLSLKIAKPPQASP